MENISKVLELGNSKEKIRILETLDNIDDPKILEKIISKLDDDDVEVFLEALLDSNIEVKKSALQGITDLKIIISNEKINEIFKEKDYEIKKMISLIKKK